MFKNKVRAYAVDSTLALGVDTSSTVRMTPPAFSIAAVRAVDRRAHRSEGR
jgi:hypothetical protein